MAKKGKKTAYVALARKILTIIWHLLVNGEKTVRMQKAVYRGHVPLEEMVEVLRHVGYIVIDNGLSKKGFS